MLYNTEPSDRASDGSDLISTMNYSRSLVAEMRFKPLDARSDGSKVRSTVHSSNPKSATHGVFIAYFESFFFLFPNLFYVLLSMVVMNLSADMEMTGIGQ